MKLNMKFFFKGGALLRNGIGFCYHEGFGGDGL